MGWTNRRLRHRARIASKVLVLVSSILGLKYVICTPGAVDCEHTARSNNLNHALLVCRDEYLATQAPATGARLANILRRSRNFATARALANNLLATSARSDALQVLGKISITEK